MAKSLFEFGRAIERGAETERSTAELRAEVEKFDLAGTGGFLSAVKYLVFAILASLNFHLFYEHVPGVWGVALGCIALLFEACAVHFWNKQNKSAGAHKTALQAFAVVFTTTSFVHGCAALYQLSGVGPSLAEPIYNYSKYVAFPLLFGLMVLAVCVLHYLHWSTKISEARAAAQLETQQGRAELLTESVKLKDQVELEKARLESFRERLLLEQDYVSAIDQFAQVKARGQKALAAISDPDTRRELYAMMGRVMEEPQQMKRISPLPAATTGSTDDGPKS